MHSTPHDSQPVTRNSQLAIILIAEDQETNLQTLASYLASRGYRIILAQTGKEAFKQAQNGHPDLILMDIQMPEMNGLEAIQKIRNSKCAHYCPHRVSDARRPGKMFSSRGR